MKIRVKITRDGSGEIRTLDLEEYLRGVVPSEIKASSCPMAAQQAQAIAARTYAMRKIQSRKAKDYDVDDTANYQAYGARPEHTNSDRAVALTRGQYITHNGKLIDAVYSHSNGGRCVSALARWGTAVPYLIDQPDPWDNGPRVNGHGVGLSQTGAENMAKAGKTCAEILAFYYPHTKIEELIEMTEKEIRSKVVATAKAWLGLKESDGSHGAVLDVYNAHKPLARSYKVKKTDAWCATFVSAVAIKCGLTDIMPTECSCGKMIELYKKMGRWQESDTYVPAPGDVLMYDWDDSGRGDNTGWPEHVGIVEMVAGDTLTIIEGNKNNAVARRTIKVGAKTIRGYCLPDYASLAGSVESVDKPVEKAPTDDQVAFIREVQGALGVTVDGIAGAETLRATISVSAGINRRHALVKILQRRLAALGYSQVGAADGIAGNKFTAAVKAYQLDHGCVADGVITKKAKTWRTLLGME